MSPEFRQLCNSVGAIVHLPAFCKFPRQFYNTQLPREFCNVLLNMLKLFTREQSSKGLLFTLLFVVLVLVLVVLVVVVRIDVGQIKAF
jgi:hypothetical protein